MYSHPTVVLLPHLLPAKGASWRDYRRQLRSSPIQQSLWVIWIRYYPRGLIPFSCRSAKYSLRLSASEFWRARRWAWISSRPFTASAFSYRLDLVVRCADLLIESLRAHPFFGSFVRPFHPRRLGSPMISFQPPSVLASPLSPPSHRSLCWPPTHRNTASPLLPWLSCCWAVAPQQRVRSATPSTGYWRPRSGPWSAWRCPCWSPRREPMCIFSRRQLNPIALCETLCVGLASKVSH